MVPEIVAATPVTLSLVLGAAVIWVVVSILMGVAAAVLRGTIFDPMLMVLALIGISMPVFWLGEMANLITQDRYHDTFLFSWVPPLGYTPLTQDPVMWFKHLVIPWLVLSVLYIGLYARVLRADLLETENEDYVRTARAKGLSERRVLLRHTLRTSMISFVSLFGLDFGVLVGGGALLVEVVFGLPGVGLLTYQSLISLDLPVIMATVIYGAIFIVFANALVDVGLRLARPAGAAGMSGAPLLEVRDLSVSFRTQDGTVHAVDGVSFTVNRGEVLGIVGESGSGKSVTAMTLMRLILDQNAVFSGEVLFDGRDLMQLSQGDMLQVRGKQIAMIFQDPMTSLNPVYRVGWQIDEQLRAHEGMSAKQARRRTLELLGAVGIPNPRGPRSTTTRTSSPAACASA